MPHSQLTQCPHCKASFKVSEEQLSAANGRVRCGACLNIFDAIAYQISTNSTSEKHPNTSNTKQSSKQSDDSLFIDDDLSDDVSPTKSAFDTTDDDDFFADDPEEDRQEKGYSGSSLGDELSTSFLELEKSGKDPFKTQFINEDDIDLTNDEAIDESWTESILDDLETPETKPERKEPSFSLDEPAEAPAISAKDDELTSSPSESAYPAFDQKELNELKFHYDQDETPKRRWFLGTCLFLLNLALLLILLAQTSWFHYEKLAKYPQIAAIYEQICERLECTLPELRDLSKIENRNLVVRSHPTAFNALIIETVMTNNASFEQAFPHISLSFSNINNQTIAQRLFKPEEYLRRDLIEQGGFAPNQPLQITLEIIDPGPEAVNYKINFHPAPSDSLDQ